MSDSISTCGKCVHFIPTLDPDTGQECCSYTGKCGWNLPAWREWPIAYKRASGYVFPVPVWRDTPAADCPQFQARGTPPRGNANPNE